METVVKFHRHLIWEDGYYNQKSNISSFKISIFPPKQEALAIKSNCSELGSEADDAIQVLVEKIMASQVHFFGDGCVYLHLVILHIPYFLYYSYTYF